MQFRVGDLVCQNVEFEILVRYADIMRLSRERNNNCAMIFTEFPSQLLVIADDEDRLILKAHVPEKCPDTILSLFDHLKKLLLVPCIISVDVNVRSDFRKYRSVRNGRQIAELGKLKIATTPAASMSNIVINSKTLFFFAFISSYPAKSNLHQQGIDYSHIVILLSDFL